MPSAASTRIDRLKFFVIPGVTLLIFVLTLLLTDPYSFELVGTNFNGKNMNFLYADLDNDGTTERIEYHRYAEGISSILAFKDDQLIDQWNYRGEFVHLPEPIIEDLYADGTREIVVFTLSHDSVYMHGLDAINQVEVFKDIQVSTISPYNGSITMAIRPIATEDINRAGIKEIYFSIMTGFSTRPRNLFAFDPSNGQLKVSPESCAAVNLITMADLDNDSVPEFFGRTTAFHNCDSGRAYTDHFSWLMVFTPELQFKFEPVQMGEYPSSLQGVPFASGDSTRILALHDLRGQGAGQDYLEVFNESGTSILKKAIPYEAGIKKTILFTEEKHSGNIYLLNSAGEIYSINEALEFRNVDDGKYHLIAAPLYVDIDKDGETEYLFRADPPSQYILFRKGFRHPTMLDLEFNPQKLLISIVESDWQGTTFCFSAEDERKYFRYRKTLVYQYWFLFLPLLFGTSLLLWAIIRRSVEYRQLRLAQSRNQLAELQMRSIQNQLDPHFTFNVIQSFGALLNESDKERAEMIFDRYAGLLKNAVMNSDTVFVKLAEELEFVESYIQLERFRQQERFDYSITVDEGVDTSLLIPKMLVHIFVENALKHGLRHLEKEGMLEIAISKNQTGTEVRIADNGIGRKKAAELARFSTGKGLGIMDQMLELYNALHRRNIKYEIIDLEENSEAKGTMVRIPIES